ncbi:NAD(P)/FAD-dependent oxidoreductase [Nocardioides sp. J9]|uniref:NAD(P)/FAD-dependent oxidoreductase n=1 Tax=Nocardioides sp. J9 TaxID=935844 RepID=UPI0021BDACD9|nr:FAD/NAD(P)-binding oxidoreductase [Nocardioides sp. J9]
MGLGAAGLASVEALRRGGWAGSITVLSAEEHIPYDRPPLSKGYLSSGVEEAKLALSTSEKLAALDLDIRWGTSAERLDPDRAEIVDSNGVTHCFDHLVIATGVRARGLPGAQLDGVLTLRTRDDADALRARLAVSEHLVVVGGGFLGLEVASTARGLGVAVDVVEPLDVPLRNRIGEVASDALVGLHLVHGVSLHTGVGVAAFLPGADGRRVEGVRLSDGGVLPADTVLVSIGGQPDVDWLRGAGLDLDDGVVCDRFSCVRPGIWAAGDVAQWEHPALGRPMRLEHRMNAAEQGRAVAQGILGSSAAFAPVPFFWTDQYDARIQMAGVFSEGAVEVVTEYDGGTRFLVEFQVDGQTEGVLNWNAAREMIPFRQKLARAYAERAR